MRIFLILAFMVNLLFSRDNPFVPTQTFVDEKESILETKNIIPIKQNQNIEKVEVLDIAKKDTKEDLNADISKDIMVHSKAIKERKSRKIIKPVITMITNNKSTDKIDTNNIDNTPNVNSSKLIKHTKPFPYLEVFEYEDSLVISSKYKILKKFMIYKPYKIAVDFQALVPEKSSVVRLNNSLFEKFVFGNHPKKGFFRIVMYPKENPYHYERTYTDYTITMKKKNQYKGK